MFNPVSKELQLPELEREVLKFWERNEVERRYLARNQSSATRFRFLDGPITANGLMGVHHAWGRMYKDLWQRYHNMLGARQRFQNGFDGQGLWVEVTVERELGFKNKRDIEAYGVPEFVRKCKESVFHFADAITRQSRRLGYFMDWDNSYYTLSDQNNYTIWHFLKRCHERGLIYLGTDVMPWCTRCATGISDAEAAESYETMSHRTVTVALPLVDAPGEHLLVWTTTPWTLTSNVAVAVNPDIEYVRVRQDEKSYYVARGAIERRSDPPLSGDFDIVGELPGSALVGRVYAGPFDCLPALKGVEHTIIPWGDVSPEEGTGLVHIAPGCGAEDFALGKEFDLPAIAPIDQNGIYVSGFDWLTGRDVQRVADDVIEDLRQRGLVHSAGAIEHRYPTCWRCHTPLVFRLVDEWFIAMAPLREPMMDLARQIRWIPEYGLDRELDWLRNMGDWMISKKRYWGLALPFWTCPEGHLTVIGGKDELYRRALSGLDRLESPHRPWIDGVTIGCSECGRSASRVPDVGNVWLDAGIVPYATLEYSTDRAYWEEWFPADFITESFPGQFRNWFYSMLAMSAVLENTAPFRTVLGYALMRDQDGREMHKSWGNLIPFDEAADRAGADLMRWLFCLHDPAKNLNFGYGPLDDVKRDLLVWWNTYVFFVTYARLDGWVPEANTALPQERTLMDRWVIARLNETIREVRAGLDAYDNVGPARKVNGFIQDLSTWYVRRNRRRFWKSEADADKRAAYTTLYECLTSLTHLTAPFLPFLSEELYQNLVRTANRSAPLSVHLADYPVADETAIDDDLLAAMSVAQRIVALGRGARDKSGLRVRQPLARMWVKVPTSGDRRVVEELRDIILDELNVKSLEFAGADESFMEFSVRPNLPLLGPKYGRLVGEIRRGLDALDPAAVVAAVEAGQPVHVVIDGRSIELLADEVLTDARERAGFAALASDGFLIALDTQLTPELTREGWAREVIRRVNDWRRAGGFNVEDRITIRYRVSPDLELAFQDFDETIRQETLAVSLEPAHVDETGFRAEASFGGQTLEVWLKRAA